MDVKYFSLSILINLLLLFNEVVSNFNTSISIVDMTICEHVHAGYEPSDNFFILEAAFVLYFLFFDVVNVKSVILTVLALTFQEKYKLLGNFIITEFDYIFCN